MNDAPVLDRTVLVELEQMVGRDGVRELIDLFADSAASQVQAALDGAASDDHEATSQALHSLRSSAGMIGALELEGHCARLERALAGEGDPCVAALLAELKQAQARAVDSLQGYLR